MRDYYCRHAGIARKNGTGFILESATWRASPDWGDKLGYSAQALDGANRKAIALLRELKAEFETERSPMIISGCTGPRGDGYDPGKAMSPEQAQAYHARQTGVFADAGVDLVTANTMTNMNEAIGVTRTELDDGNPIELGLQYRDLRRRFGHINVLGGCCGTDHRHIEQICTSCMKAA